MSKIKKINKKNKAIKKLIKRKVAQRRLSRGIEHRHKAEKRFKLYGIASVSLAIVFLVLLLFNIISSGYSAFFQTQIRLNVDITTSMINQGNYNKILYNSLYGLFPEVDGRRQKRKLHSLISDSAGYNLNDMVTEDPALKEGIADIWVPASSDIDMFYKGKISRDVSEDQRRVSDSEIEWIDSLVKQDRIKKTFNVAFFTLGDSREPEMAGILGSFIGSCFVVIVCMIAAFPLGVMTAIYLEEFASKNKITDFIEININNLAAVPSIIFGLLGLALYIQILGIPRSASLAGGLTLALMALPVIVISTRASIRSIPQSIRDGALALGASRLQTTFHHVLPLAMPGIMTGSILSVARVLGETAPLLMIGMVAFIVDIPSDFLEASSAMPVQIYLWADSPELGFVEKTSAAIIILLALLLVINLFAAFVRKKFEIRW